MYNVYTNENFWKDKVKKDISTNALLLKTKDEAIIKAYAELYSHYNVFVGCHKLLIKPNNYIPNNDKKKKISISAMRRIHNKDGSNYKTAKKTNKIIKNEIFFTI